MNTSNDYAGAYAIHFSIDKSYKAFEMAFDILEQGLNPSSMRTAVPPKGPLMVNRNRAKTLGISLEDKMDAIDEIIEISIALER